jgi:DNA-binding transcriptional MerR regulator
MGFLIKELETLTGIKAHTIRIWEQRYQFLKPSRTATNIRTYSNDELKTLLTVALLNRYGYKISRINQMSSERRNEEVLNLKMGDAETEHLTNELIKCMIDLRINEFELILEKHLKDHGLFHSITTLIFQFLERTGILWQTGRINAAHEHIVSNIIRQKIIAAIDKLPSNSKSGPLILLLLPEYEFHELGLLFVYFLLKQKGQPVIYLGANVPLKDVAYVIRLKEPAYTYMHLTSSSTKLNIHNFIVALQAHSKVLLSGVVTENLSKKISSRVQVLKSFSEVLSYIDKL